MLKYLFERLRRLRESLRYAPRAFRLVWQITPVHTAAWLALIVLQGVLPAAGLYLTKRLVDGLSQLVGRGLLVSSEKSDVLFAAFALAAVLVLIEGFNVALGWIKASQSRHVSDYFQSTVLEKAVSVDLAVYDTPAFHDQLHRAQSDSSYRPVQLLDHSGGALQHTITLLAISGLLLPYGALIVLALAISALPGLIVFLHFAQLQHAFLQRSTADERRANYLSDLMTRSAYAAELRVAQVGTRLRETYAALRDRLRGTALNLERQRAVGTFLASMAAFVVGAACLLWVLLRAIRGEATLGDVALFYQAFSQGQRVMGSLAASAGQMYENSLFLGNLFSFLDLRGRIEASTERGVTQHAPHVTDAAGSVGAPLVAFQDVSFSYANADTPALRGFTMTVNPQQIVAIVGFNGAGKSTIVKLLSRLYDVDSGAVLVDGRDVREWSLEQLRSQVSVLFQSPIEYQASVLENVAPRANAVPPDVREAVRVATVASGADEFIRDLPDGYDTVLGTRFTNGVELSRGQWQRIALARAILQPSRLLVLDEPTSAMDSWAEARWIDRLRPQLAGRATIIITHRFTTAMKADMIHVMEAGRILESGTHAELIATQGLYAQSWAAQMYATAS